MRCSGTATEYAAGLLRRPAEPARVLGRFDTACYLELAGGEVLALLTADAVQLPIGLTLSQQLPAGFPDVSVGVVGDGQVRLGPLVVVAQARRSARLHPAGLPRVPAERCALYADPVATVAARLGRGPGLTPAGDDELCGALAANTLFEIEDSGLAAAVRNRLEQPRATTGLSAALLRRAVAGDGLPELQDLGRALCGQGSVPAAWSAVVRIGHSSGPALAAGLLAGARHAAARAVAA